MFLSGSDHVLDWTKRNARNDLEAVLGFVFDKPPSLW